MHDRSAELHDQHALEMDDAHNPGSADRARRIAHQERATADGERALAAEQRIRSDDAHGKAAG